LHGFAQSSDPGARVNVGTLQAGTALNIVPDRAVLGFEIRASTMTRLEDLDGRCRAATEHIAAAYGVGWQTELRGEAADWKNDSQMIEWADSVNAATGAFTVAVRSFDFGASEDATLLARSVADAGGRAALFVAGADLHDGHHTQRFDFDEGVLPKSVFFLTALVADALLQPRAEGLGDRG
jgi:aminobenzoyl-glutamate utilization protein A